MNSSISPALALVGSLAAATVLTAATETQRTELVRRARVWAPVTSAALDLRAGPTGPGAFEPTETVVCDYVDRKMSGRSPKFACAIGEGDEVKVKYGGTNGEVYGEIAASRLLWALGFPADRMYSVKVICRGCPAEFGGIARENGDRLFDPAVIERKVGRELKLDGGEGWSWKELEGASGRARAERDALKLLAVFLQHTDNKKQQQRVVCLDDPHADARPPAAQKKGTAMDVACDQPFLMINDLGLTFGKASWANDNTTSSMNLVGWLSTPVWKDAPGCVGNLPKSLTGTLEDPVIGEEGRALLAQLLAGLSDRELRDIFDAARVHLRPRDPGRGRSGFPTADDWVQAFKIRRAQIIDRRCN